MADENRQPPDRQDLVEAILRQCESVRREDIFSTVETCLSILSLSGLSLEECREIRREVRERLVLIGRLNL